MKAHMYLEEVVCLHYSRSPKSAEKRHNSSIPHASYEVTKDGGGGGGGGGGRISHNTYHTHLCQTTGCSHVLNDLKQHGNTVIGEDDSRKPLGGRGSGKGYGGWVAVLGNRMR